MEQDEQPEIQDDVQDYGGDPLNDILNEGLEGQEDTPTEAVSQTEEEELINQPTEETQEELLGELLLADEQKMPFKSQEELEAFIERNQEVLEKSGYFMRQADYTRKTQELSKEREEYEAEKQAELEAWGDTKPDEGSMSAFRDLWTVFQHGSDEVKQQINAFVNDVSNLAQGKNPENFFKQEQGQTNQSVNPEVISLRRELSQLKREMEQGKTELTESQKRAEYDQAKRDWDSWETQKVEQGLTLDPKLREAMVPYIQASDPSMKATERLEIAYELANKKLGRTQALETKKVLRESKDKSKKTPMRPSSKASINANPEASSIEGILQNGMNELSA